MKEGYFFKSRLFQIEPGEDEETNPRRYGKQLAVWLRSKLDVAGYETEDVIPEDWGWCVVCQREPFFLFVACGSVNDYDTARPGDPPPPAEAVVWHCVPHAELSILQRMFRKVDTKPALDKLDSALKSIISAELGIEVT